MKIFSLSLRRKTKSLVRAKWYKTRRQYRAIPIRVICFRQSIHDQTSFWMAPHISARLFFWGLWPMKMVHNCITQINMTMKKHPMGAQQGLQCCKISWFQAWLLSLLYLISSNPAMGKLIPWRRENTRAQSRCLSRTFLIRFYPCNVTCNKKFKIISALPTDARRNELKQYNTKPVEVNWKTQWCTFHEKVIPRSQPTSHQQTEPLCTISIPYSNHFNQLWPSHLPWISSFSALQVCMVISCKFTQSADTHTPAEN